MKKAYLLILLLSVLTLPFSASAQVTVTGIAASVAGNVVAVATWIVVIMWVVTGILFLTAQGDPAKLKAGKTALFAAIGGTVLVILANGAIALVQNSLGI